MKTATQLKEAATRDGVTTGTAAYLTRLASAFEVLDGMPISIVSIKASKPVLGEISRVLEMEGQIEQPTVLSPFYALQIAPRIWIRTEDVKTKLLFEELAA